MWSLNLLDLTGIFAYRGASLCSGHLHPDKVIQEERRLKAEKKAYYSELQDYHNEYVKNNEIYP